MFDATDFKQIINNTTALVDQLRGADEDEAEELQMRIDSNIQSLRIVGAQITDPVLREQAQDLVKSLNASMDFGTEEIVARLRKSDAKDHSDLIETELYKNTQQLKSMAQTFGESLRADKRILGKLTHKMTRSSAETGRNLSILESAGHGMAGGTYLFIAFVMFIVMYFVIKFM